MLGVTTCTKRSSTHASHSDSFSAADLPPHPDPAPFAPTRFSISRMIALESLSCSSSIIRMGTFFHSVLNFISDLVRGFTSTTS